MISHSIEFLSSSSILMTSYQTLNIWKKNWKLCQKRRYLPSVLTVPNLYMFVVIATVELYVSKSLLKFTDKKLCMPVCLIDEAHLNEVKLVLLLLIFSNKNSSTHKRLLGTLRWVTASANEIQRKDLGIIKVQGVRRVSDDVTQHILNSISANVQCSLELIRAVILSGRACKCRRLTHDNSHQTPRLRVALSRLSGTVGTRLCL